MGVSIRTTSGFTDLYVLFRGTLVAVPAYENEDLDLGWYETSDAALALANLPAGTYTGAFLHGDHLNPDALDPEEGIFTDFVWNGLTTEPTLDAIADAVAQQTLIASALGTIATNLDAKVSEVEGGGGTIIPVSQIPVPLSRTWILKHTGDGLVGEVPLIRYVGESHTFACDFRADLSANGRVTNLDDVAVLSGPNGGLTISTNANDQGVDRSQAKFKLTLNTAGTYPIAIQVTYDDGDGSGTSDAIVTLIAKDVA